MAFADSLTKRLMLLIDANSQGAVRELQKVGKEADQAAKAATRIGKVDIPTTGIGTFVDEVRAKGGVGAKALDTLGISGKNASAVLTGALAGGAVLAGAALIKFGADGVKAASNLNESLNKSKVIFGSAADEVADFGASAAKSFGLSQRAAVDAASSFGVLFQSLGKGSQATAGLSVQFTKLAGDLSSFFNISGADAVQKLLSGLSGEAEPLRRVGVFLTEAKVKAEAYASGIAKLGAELTESQKIQARANVILRETAVAQGDFGRTSGSLANLQRTLKADIENLSASFGQVLLPAMVGVVKVADGVVTGLLAILNGVKDLAEALGDLTPWWKDNAEGATVTDTAIRALVNGLQQGGKYAADFAERLRTDPQFAASIGEMAAKFPELKAAIQAATTEVDKFDAATKAATQAAIDSIGLNRALEQSQRGLRDALRDLANVSKEQRLAELDRQDSLAQIARLSQQVTTAERAVTTAEEALTAALVAQDQALRNAERSRLALVKANADLAAAELDWQRTIEGTGAASAQYARASEDVARAQLRIRQAQLGVQQALADVADAERNLASVRRNAYAEYQRELAQAKLTLEQSQAALRSTAVELAAYALAAGQAADAQRLLADAGASTADVLAAQARATALLAQAQTQAAADARAIADAQRAAADAQDRVRDATTSLNEALEQQRRVLQGYGADSREAADALRDLNGAQLDASDAALDVADAVDRVTQARANLAKAQAAGNQADITRAEREVQRALNAEARARQRLEDARKAAGVAQVNAQGTVSGFAPDSQQARAAQAEVDKAKVALTQAQTAASAAVAAVGAAQAQAAQNAVAWQQATAAAVQSLTFQYRGQQLQLQQNAAEYRGLLADAGRPEREIAAAQRELDGARQSAESAVYALRDAEDDLNEKLRVQEGYLKGFKQGSPEYVAAYDKLRSAQANASTAADAYASAVRAQDGALKATKSARDDVVAKQRELKEQTAEAARQTERIRIQMTLAKGPAEIYAARLNAAKDAAFRVAENQAKVWDNNAKVNGTFVEGKTPAENYAKALKGVAGYAGPLASYMRNLAQTLPTVNTLLAAQAQIPQRAPAPAAAARPGTTPGGGGGGGAFAAGGYMPAGGPHLVGEKGPELVFSSTGRTVVSNDAIRAALAGGSNRPVAVAPGAIQLTVQGSVDQSVLPAVRQMLDDAMGELQRRMAAGRR